MTSRSVAIGLLLCGVACSKQSVPSAPTPVVPTRVIRLNGNLNFGDVQVAEVRTDGVLIISNDGTAPLAVTAVTTPNSGVYTPNWTSGTIAPGASQTVAISFAPAAEQGYSGSVTVSGDQTSGTNTIAVIGTGTRPPRRAVVADPAGDARPFLGVVEPILRDLVGATIDVNAGVVTLTMAFAPGTSLTPDVVCTVHLDTDENRATGTQSSLSDPTWIGADYAIFFTNTRASGRADIYRWAQTSFVQVGTADVAFPSADQVRIALPLSLLDNDDGRFAFKMWAGARTASGIGAVDFLPDLGAPAGLTR